MKTIYESYSEIASDFVNGDHWTHKLSDHTPDECLAWQQGICEFAKWLDAYGLKLASNPAIYDLLWAEVRTAKPSSFSPCPKQKGVLGEALEILKEKQEG